MLGARTGVLWVVAIAVRVVAAGVLLFGPWTDTPDELTGWDAERFQEIADTEGRPWVDHPVEYPPGSVLLIEAIGRDSVVGTQRVLVGLSLVIDLAVAALLDRFARRGVGPVYLLLGLPLVPAGLLRFDLWAAGLGAVGLLALHRRNAGLFAAAVAAGFAIKIAPALLIPTAFSNRRMKEAAGAFALTLAAVAAWVAYGGTDAINQVISLRGVTGWHLESVVGSILALVTDEEPRLEANAYRIGQLNNAVVFGGRLLLVATIVSFRRITGPGPATLSRMALMFLACTAALIVTSPLISPQFLLWLVPAAAISWVGDDHRPLWLTAGAITMTAGTLAGFGPPGLGHPLAAVLLLARDALLVGVIVASGRSLWVSRTSVVPA